MFSMESKSFHHILFSVALLAAVFGTVGWFIWKDFKAADAPEVVLGGSMVAPAEEQPATTTTDEKASEAPREDPLKAQMPSLTRAIPAGASADNVAEINEVIGLIKENYNYLQAWLQLGILRESVKDYEGAAEAWKFATILRPKSSTAFLNLGNLYGWYLHDNAKAESYLLAGVAAEPGSAYPYYKTYEFYLEVLNDTAKARAILEQGLTKVPDDKGLKQALDNL